MSPDDPLAAAKNHCSDVAPGVRLFEAQPGNFAWHSDYVWLIVTNEEDGLDFLVARKTDGSRDLHMLYDGEHLQQTSDLGDRLRKHPLWDIFQLRAVTIVQERIEAQLHALSVSEPKVQEVLQGIGGSVVRDGPRELALRLRDLEGKLLQQCLEALEQEVKIRACIIMV